MEKYGWVACLVTTSRQLTHARPSLPKAGTDRQTITLTTLSLTTIWPCLSWPLGDVTRWLSGWPGFYSIFPFWPRKTTKMAQQQTKRAIERMQSTQIQLLTGQVADGDIIPKTKSRLCKDQVETVVHPSSGEHVDGSFSCEPEQPLAR